MTRSKADREVDIQNALDEISVREKSLINWIITEEAAGRAPGRAQVAAMAEGVLRESDDFEPVGHNWVTRFLGRHPEIKMRISRSLAAERSLASTREAIESHIARLDKMVTNKHLLPQNTYNMDETGVSEGETYAGKVCGTSLTKQATVTESDCREWATIIECGNALGKLLTPARQSKKKVRYDPNEGFDDVEQIEEARLVAEQRRRAREKHNEPDFAVSIEAKGSILQMAPAKARPRQDGYDNHHGDFIKQFTQQHSQKVNKKKPVPLSAAQRANLREQLKDVHFLKPDYADNTKINIAGILRKWKRYCKTAELGHWKAVIEKADRAMAMDFLDHLCEVWTITSEGTSWEYWRQYKQLYSSVTGRYVDRNDNREILKWHDAYLVPRHGLQPPNIDGKPVIDVNDLLALQVFNIAYDTRIFPSERHRLNLTGIYSILAFTGARPAELVDNEKKKPKDGTWEELWGKKAISRDEENSRLLEELLVQETEGRGRPKALCYEDVSLMVVRDPSTGRDVLTMAIKFIHHKGADNKLKPLLTIIRTIFFFTLTRRPLMCPILIIISLACADNAFDARGLTKASDVFSIKNRGPVVCTPIRWKREWLKRPIFRRLEGSVTSEEKAPHDVLYEALPYHKLRDDMEKQTLDAGFEEAIGPKAFRRGTANAANGNTSDAVRDQMMRHDPKWATFNSAYINEKVEFHVQNAFLEEPTEDGLIKLFTHISIMRDPRASYDMVPDEIWNSLPPDPRLAELEAQRDKLKNGQYRVQGKDNEAEVRRLTNEIQKLRAQRKKAVQRLYRKYYFYHRPTWDIEKQIARALEDDEESEEDDKYEPPPINLHIPERARLAHILCHQADDLTNDDLRNLRIEATGLMTALCNKRETVKRKYMPKKLQVDMPMKAEPPDLNQFPLLMKKTQCPGCIGDCTISQEERTFSYSRPAVMNDHFDREHIKPMKKAEQSKSIICEHPRCRINGRGLSLRSLDHFRNHVQSVHGVWLRPERNKV
ncbi:hypothetical protein S7711_09571 [Stachybotrys chartarum IBT 7711]|uniref:HTH CENPB-type domain-containing protein n=1 Tax=Stachybotrys chartarum (strain CBS 109288 / IBT 7711) TaxID=1280523 RepID=A0A084B816_STACB|nr:hypothetical protein S7711_09571 [Stachybotrys chartarum IBT 7711]